MGDGSHASPHLPIIIYVPLLAAGEQPASSSLEGQIARNADVPSSSAPVSTETSQGARISGTNVRASSLELRSFHA